MFASFEESNWWYWELERYWSEMRLRMAMVLFISLIAGQIVRGVGFISLGI